MSTSPGLHAKTLLEEGKRILALPVKDPTRAASLMLLTPQCLASMVELLKLVHQWRAYHEAYAAEHEKLVSLVHALLEATTAATNGTNRWATELPAGKAPVFRRCLNAIIRFVKTREINNAADH